MIAFQFDLKLVNCQLQFGFVAEMDRRKHMNTRGNVLIAARKSDKQIKKVRKNQIVVYRLS